MDFLRAFILGLIQAVTEFLPISSSAHLILFRTWLGFESIDGLTFDVALHIGTLLAIIVYFQRDIRMLITGFVDSIRRGGTSDDIQRRLPWYIIAATVPSGLAGTLLSDVIENVLRRPSVIVITLVAGGILFMVVERVARQVKDIEHITLKMGLIIGVAQSLALIPGVSRSGITIVAGMSQQLKRAEAARFSFLLSIPALLGAGLKKAMDIGDLALSGEQILVLVTGLATSAVAGWIVIKYFLQFLRRHRLDFFALYRYGLAAAVLWWLIR